MNIFEVSPWFVVGLILMTIGAIGIVIGKLLEK